MGNRIIEIVELGKPQSIIQREFDPISELIYTDDLVKELNEQLSIHNTISQRKQFIEVEKLCRMNQNFVCNCIDDSICNLIN
jgi:hypothetical protein